MNTIKLTDKQKKLAEDNIRLAFKHTTFLYNNSFIKSKLSFEEIQESCLYALILAARGYRPERNIKFSTYAYKAMDRQTLRDARNTQAIHIPKYKHISSPRIVSLSKLDFDVLEDKYEKKLIISKMDLSCLKKREREIFKLYYVKGLRLHQIGKRFDITKERVRQIKDRCIEKIREFYETHDIEEAYG